MFSRSLEDFESLRTFPEVIEEEMVDSDLAEIQNSSAYTVPVVCDHASFLRPLADVDENEAKRREVMKRKKHKRWRGLSFEDAEEVIVMFSKVAVVKQRVSTQEQVGAVWGVGLVLLPAALPKSLFTAD